MFSLGIDYKTCAGIYIITCQDTCFNQNDQPVYLLMQLAYANLYMVYANTQAIFDDVQVCL